MRKPRQSDAPPEPTPPGGRALGRARQFAASRGLPEPEPTIAPAHPAKKPARKTAR